MSSNEEQDNWEKLSEDALKNHAKGNVFEAELLYNAALSAIKRTQTKLALCAAKLYYRLGDLYSEREDYPKAETLYRHSLAEYEGMEGDHVIDICIVLTRISELCRLQCKDRQASSLASRSKRLLNIKRKILEKNFSQGPKEESA